MDDRFNIEGRVALVTGASSGLGRQFALTLARAGAKVALCARRMDRLAQLADEISEFDGRALPVELDVTNAGSVREAVQATETELGAISIVVNNSGVAIVKPPLEFEEADWDTVLDTNLKGAWLVAREAASAMARHGHGGSIINIASMLAERITGQNVAYAASKAGLVHMTHALAFELARYGIRVNAISPGYIETEMNRDFLASKRGQEMLKRVPLRRYGKPEDLDGVLMLLASDASEFITGAVIAADGGHAVASVGV
ncbi:MAG: glucose 1-dehydrogenase [Alphaproteobacteria bacterium]|nr:glucose 1-dehydrogenase [Alphaproteobacteria bacterium]